MQSSLANKIEANLKQQHHIESQAIIARQGIQDKTKGQIYPAIGELSTQIALDKIQAVDLQHQSEINRSHQERLLPYFTERKEEIEEDFFARVRAIQNVAYSILIGEDDKSRQEAVKIQKKAASEGVSSSSVQQLAQLALHYDPYQRALITLFPGQKVSEMLTNLSQESSQRAQSQDAFEKKLQELYPIVVEVQRREGLAQSYKDSQLRRTEQQQEEAMTNKAQMDLEFLLKTRHINASVVHALAEDAQQYISQSSPYNAEFMELLPDKNTPQIKKILDDLTSANDVDILDENYLLVARLQAFKKIVDDANREEQKIEAEKEEQLKDLKSEFKKLREEVVTPEIFPVDRVEVRKVGSKYINNQMPLRVDEFRVGPMTVYRVHLPEVGIEGNNNSTNFFDGDFANKLGLNPEEYFIAWDGIRLDDGISREEMSVYDPDRSNKQAILYRRFSSPQKVPQRTLTTSVDKVSIRSVKRRKETVKESDVVLIDMPIWVNGLMGRDQVLPQRDPVLYLVKKLNMVIQLQLPHFAISIFIGKVFGHVFLALHNMWRMQLLIDK